MPPLSHTPPTGSLTRSDSPARVECSPLFPPHFSYKGEGVYAPSPGGRGLGEGGGIKKREGAHKDRGGVSLNQVFFSRILENHGIGCHPHTFWIRLKIRLKMMTAP